MLKEEAGLAKAKAKAYLEKATQDGFTMQVLDFVLCPLLEQPLFDDEFFF